MKKIYLILFAAILAWSCSEDFLERYPLDEISPNDYWKTPNDLKLYCNQFYNVFPVHRGWSGGIFWFDNNSDNMVPGSFNNRLAGKSSIPASGGWSWSDIRKINYMLANLSTVVGNEADIKSYIAEARFFRAWYYFDKVKSYGAVPWISKPLNIDSPELYNGRDARNVVVDSIIVDIDYAIANLKSKSTAEAFRLNKDIALAFKSRVCLYEGTWEKYHANSEFGVSGSDGSKYLTMAASAAKQIIDDAHYGIYKPGNVNTDYHSLFNKTDYSSVNEVIMWKKYDVDLGVTHNMSRYIPHYGGNTGISKSLVDSYLCTDGNPISTSSLYDVNNESSLATIIKDRDPRLAQIILTPKDIMNINGTDTTRFEKPNLDRTGAHKSTNGYQLYKGGTTEYELRKQGNIGTIGAIIFRYAEILLNYAEAKAELGTLTQDDVNNSINLIRQRAGMPDMNISALPSETNKAFPAVSDVINEIRRERRVELACEGFRLNDIMRWRAHHLIVGKRLKGFKYVGSDIEGKYLNDAGEDKIKVGTNLFIDANGYIDPYQKTLPDGYAFDPKRDYLNAIATEELVLNPKLGQNPGWE